MIDGIFSENSLIMNDLEATRALNLSQNILEKINVALFKIHNMFRQRKVYIKLLS